MIYRFSKQFQQNIFEAESLAGKSVIIFGAGLNGRLAFHALNKRNIDVLAFADNAEKKWGTIFCERPVFSLDDLRNQYPDAIYLISPMFGEEITKQLEQTGIKNYFDCVSLFSTFDLDGLSIDLPQGRIIKQLELYLYTVLSRKEKSKLILKSLDVVVSERCSLRCRDCANLMQFYENPQDCDIEQLFEALDCFMKSIDRIYELRVLGGEPFLFQKLDNTLQRLLQYDRYDKIVVLTNGTIVPKDNLIEILSNENITVEITDYGPLSRNLNQLTTILDQYGIQYYVTKTWNWQRCDIIEDFKRTRNEKERLFANCCVNDTLTLLHGRLYRCPFAAHAENLNAIPSALKDSIDLLEETDTMELRNKIIRLHHEIQSVEACNFCPGRDFNALDVPAAVQTTKPLTYCKRT